MITEFYIIITAFSNARDQKLYLLESLEGAMKSPEIIRKELEVLFGQMDELDNLVNQLARKLSTVNNPQEYMEGDKLLDETLERQREILGMIKHLSRDYWATIREPEIHY